MYVRTLRTGPKGASDEVIYTGFSKLSIATAQDANIARILRRWADAAERGEYSAIAVASVNKDGTISHEFSSGTDHIRMIGATSILHQRVLEQREQVALDPKDGA